MEGQKNNQTEQLASFNQGRNFGFSVDDLQSFVVSLLTRSPAGQKPVELFGSMSTMPGTRPSNVRPLFQVKVLIASLTSNDLEGTLWSFTGEMVEYFDKPVSPKVIVAGEIDMSHKGGMLRPCR